MQVTLGPAGLIFPLFSYRIDYHSPFNRCHVTDIASPWLTEERSVSSDLTGVGVIISAPWRGL